MMKHLRKVKDELGKEGGLIDAIAQHVEKPDLRATDSMLNGDR